jgi:hypothetical protein
MKLYVVRIILASLSKRRFWQHERLLEANLTTLSNNQHSWCRSCCQKLRLLKLANNRLHNLHASTAKATLTSTRMQHTCSTYIAHTDYTANRCTRLKQTIPRYTVDMWQCMRAMYVHMGTYTQLTGQTEIVQTHKLKCNTYSCGSYFVTVIDLPQVSLEWVLIEYIQFIMRSVLKLKRRTRETEGLVKLGTH